MSDAEDLLVRMARCPNVEACLGADGDRSHPCHQIVRSQAELPHPIPFVPEPWSGHIETAPILFLSSNPSITGEELAPTQEWSDEEIVDFYANRFGGGRREWIRDGVRNLQPGGGYRNEYVRFWASVRGRAAELMGVPSDEVRPGTDYALTEVVHCNSQQEIGVRAALHECVQQWLEPTLAVSGAKVVVCLGKFVEEVIRDRFDIRDGAVSTPITTATHSLRFAFLPHPNAFKPKTFARCMTESEMADLRGMLAGSR